MDVGAATALTLYNYQSALKNAGQATAQGGAGGSAIVQALASVSSTIGSNASGGALANLAGSSALAPLMGGLYAATLANGGTSLSLGSGTSPQAASGGLNGYSSASLSLNSTLALTAYSAKQTAGTGTTADSTQALIQSAQSSLAANTLNLLG